MGKIKSARTLWLWLLVGYGLIMLWLLFARTLRWRDGNSYYEQLLHNTNLIPFHTIKVYLSILQDPNKSSQITESIINLGGNVILFIPAGWLFPRVWPRLQNFFLFLACCAGTILLVETVQMFTLLGCFDVDDLILNVLGMCLGFVLFKLCVKG